MISQGLCPAPSRQRRSRQGWRDQASGYLSLLLCLPTGGVGLSARGIGPCSPALSEDELCQGRGIAQALACGWLPSGLAVLQGCPCLHRPLSTCLQAEPWALLLRAVGPTAGLDLASMALACPMCCAFWGAPGFPICILAGKYRLVPQGDPALFLVPQGPPSAF